tara:strand:- start:1270 stop:2256 length:987 start_codon:yes stop_codon:yes gene_type:complete
MVKKLFPAQFDTLLFSKSEHSFKCLATILKALDALIYVSDIETYELIFFNQYSKDLWPDVSQKKCFHIVHNKDDSPCEFCTNAKLIDEHGQATGTHLWEYQDPNTRRWYQCQDQAIQWFDGRLVRLEIAIDITDHKLLEQQLRVAHKKASSSANMDPLLNCLNRRAFFERFDAVLSQCQRHKYPLALVMMDVDKFKQFNDNHGHSFGDQVLLKVTAVFAKTMRESDIFARYGGDEFILALPNTTQENAVDLLTRIQYELLQLELSPESDFSITISFGLTSLIEHDTIDKLLNRADIALYQAKNSGRNRIEVYRSPHGEAPSTKTPENQ